MNFNKAIIAGNLTRDPEIRSLPSGQQVANFGVASNRYYTDQQGNKQEKAEFHNVVAFGKLADICSKYLKKGTLILVEGRIQTSNWEGQDGVKRYRTEIIMESMQMGPRAGSRQDQEAPTQVRRSGADSDQSIGGRDPDSKDVGEIPIIEAEELIENQEAETPEKNTSSEEKPGVDVKNIPF
ncbi:MAG: single-stranded DNA-binding protein [Parcubacteria group bacterium]|nr:single-stranded DNA-binding protein [Parcubacteria group bacterium]